MPSCVQLVKNSQHEKGIDLFNPSTELILLSHFRHFHSLMLHSPHIPLSDQTQTSKNYALFRRPNTKILEKSSLYTLGKSHILIPRLRPRLFRNFGPMHVTKAPPVRTYRTYSSNWTEPRTRRGQAASSVTFTTDPVPARRNNPVPLQILVCLHWAFLFYANAHTQKKRNKGH